MARCLIWAGIGAWLIATRQWPRELTMTSPSCHHHEEAPLTNMTDTSVPAFFLRAPATQIINKSFPPRPSKAIGLHTTGAKSESWHSLIQLSGEHCLAQELTIKAYVELYCQLMDNEYTATKNPRLGGDQKEPGTKLHWNQMRLFVIWWTSWWRSYRTLVHWRTGSWGPAGRLQGRATLGKWYDFWGPSSMNLNP